MSEFLPAGRRCTRTSAWARLGISVLLLVSLSGAHWWVLQSIAWSGMIVSYSARSGVLKGVEETFDGEHPCKMCKAITQARESESNPADSLVPAQPSAKLLGLLPQNQIVVFPKSFSAVPEKLPCEGQPNSPPPVPPPRVLPA